MVGHLNANTAFLGSIVVGNGINVSIILTARYLEERRRGLAVADATAISLCRDNGMPIVVFGLTDGNIARVVRGEHIGTLVRAAGSSEGTAQP